MTVLLNGIGVSRGVAIGKVHVLQRGAPEVVEYGVPPEAIDAEIARYRAALETAAAQLHAIRAKIPASAPSDVAAFIDTHLLMLQDGLLARAPVDIIRERGCNAEWALKLQRDGLVAVFDQMEDAYLRTRRDDVDHVIHRIQRVLLHEEGHGHEPGTLKGYIVVADDLTPADTVMLEHERVAGFVTEFGGPLSHTAIVARSLGIPAVVGVYEARRLLVDEEPLIVDGSRGMIVGSADATTLRHFRERQRELRRQRLALVEFRQVPARTADRTRISLMANIELPEDLKTIKRIGADGVGLYRTEFLFLNRESPPSEEEQYRDYRRVARALQGRPVTIRTMDLGADKACDPGFQGPIAPNPALGLRAIRRCLKDASLFLPQLRAILRASAYGQVRLMLPMLTNLDELEQALSMIEQAREQLRREGRRFDAKMAIGGMIEVPAAALAARAFAERLDFLSIGTNDLIQYTLAIDRTDEEVNYLYDPLHPAVLRLIHATLTAGREAGIPVAMCGEMAGDPRYTRLLLGLGLREFSMQPATLLEVKRVIHGSRLADLGDRAEAVLELHSAAAIGRLLAELNEGLQTDLQ